MGEAEGALAALAVSNNENADCRPKLSWRYRDLACGRRASDLRARCIKPDARLPSLMG